MKTSAIVRIIVFSVILFILLGVLGIVIGIDFLSFEDSGHNVAGKDMRSADSIPAGSVRDIDINWVSGDVTVISDPDADHIMISESEVSKDRDRMVCRLNGKTLEIEYCKSNRIKWFSFGSSVVLSKDLLIVVPADWDCRELEIDTASGDFKVENLAVDEMNFNSASGSCEIVNCAFGKLDLDVASGDVNFSGTLDTLDFDGASGDCTLILENYPSRIDMDVVSGNLDITLPSDCGFTVETDGLDMDFTTDFETTNRDGEYRYGNGDCHISLNGISGHAHIRDGGHHGIHH